MKQNWRKFSLLSIFVSLLIPASILAQKEDKDVKEKKEVEQIIITKKGEGKEKIVVEIDGDKVTINGKPVDEYKDKDGNVTIRKNNIRGDYYGLLDLARTPRGNIWRGGDSDNFKIFSEDENRAMLGVTTEKTEDGVKVSDVTKESAAEKIGLKEGDIITKIDDQKISDPDDLSKAIRDHKPGDKVKVTYKRDKKEQTATAELTKWKGMNLWGLGSDQNFNLDLGDMNFEKVMPKIQVVPHMTEPFNQYWSLADKKPKLGLSVQDADEGKGVKVIEVDDESNAAKAGIKENDLITEVDGKAINGTDDMVKVIRESKDKTSIMVKLQRSGKTQNIEVKMPRKIKTADL
ncbi:MAG TPA: PDZ domain-containing protein [Chitinophagaceae bacterium]|nr:PDZ domain-containing protein [Chitinophagaceae bacterium]